MIVFDANFLIYFLDPRIKGGVGSNPRIDHLVATIQKAGERIIVPTPALSELLVLAGDAAPEYLDIITRSKFFRVAEFGTRAAVEAAALQRDAHEKRSKRGTTPDATWAKVKFDRQIVAIARAVGATTIYTNDDQLASMLGPSVSSRSSRMNCQYRRCRHKSSCNSILWSRSLRRKTTRNELKPNVKLNWGRLPVYS